MSDDKKTAPDKRDDLAKFAERPATKPVLSAAPPPKPKPK